jgi:hypothetical protein
MEHEMQPMQATSVFGDKRLPSRFWDKAYPSIDGCWLWAGTMNASGPHERHWYGGYYPLRADGRIARRTIGAHRVAYAAMIGPIPEGLDVLHHCDQPKCVNPDHLYAGTHRDNMRDKVARGRCNGTRLFQIFCNRGHPYDEKNTYIFPGGLSRRCRTCKNIASARQREQARVASGYPGGSFNANKTHCKRGHKLGGSNTAKLSQHPNWRRCRMCVQLREAAARNHKVWPIPAAAEHAT